MLNGVSEDEDSSVIEELIQTIKTLRKVRLRGKIFNAKTETVTVLCECREEIDLFRVPLELTSPTEGGNWTIVIAQPQADDTNNFSEMLAPFLLDQG